jgi:ferredoxin
MACKEERYEDNAQGSYYVDSFCIACVSCITIAPNFFKMQNNNEYSVVIRQPESEKERETCEQALSLCPVNAIGNDGIDYAGKDGLCEQDN